MNETTIRNETENPVAGAAAASTARAASATARKVWAVYTIIEREHAKATWRRIGNAFVNKDGSYRLFLDALPVNGTLHMREVEAEAGAQVERV